MTIEELHDEIIAIDAIYPNTITNIASQIHTIKIPSHELVSIQLNFPINYPDSKPELLQIINDNASRFPDTNYLERNATEILEKVFTSGKVVLFELLTELQEFFDKYLEEHPENEPRPVEKKVEKERSVTPKIEALVEVIDPTIGWLQSDPIIDRNSTFIAYARRVNNLQDAQDLLINLVTDKKISKATHNISSWRIKMDNGVSYQDWDDDGETAAGSRLLHLLQMMDVWNILIVVSRWYGGIHLGPDRFKHINSAARDVIIKGNFDNVSGNANANENNTNNNTKKKKK
ncbi:unnamed protein product [Candida verbasci]|uniref:RWD domain-containing protein n=1 Tax=Candida verbasci TaxID=1227364 RepID=A0A9W4XJ73_9ASCO|nr:unnamed protein product [Candida verbasci]